MAAFKNKDNGTWYVQFRYTDWKGERQQKLKRGFATKREALEWEREFLMEKQADVNMTFESFVALYEKDIKPKLKLNTWLTKESIIKKKILPYFANRKLSEITAKDIIRWQNEIRELRDCHGKPLSKTYLKTVHNQLSAIFNHSARFYGLNINPARQAGNMGAEERKQRCLELLDMARLERDTLRRRPDELSGGQQKRLCIARALAAQPQHIIFDESFSGLDVTLKKQVLDFLKELQSELQISFLVITHDLDTAMYMAGTIHVMRRGKIIETLEHPRSFSDFQEPYSQELVKAVRSKRRALQ